MILEDYQRDKVRGGVAHVDLQEVRLDQPVPASDVVHPRRRRVRSGRQRGWRALTGVKEVNVNALPLEVPQHLDIDIWGLHPRRLAPRGRHRQAPEGVTLSTIRRDRGRDHHRADARCRGGSRGAKRAGGGESRARRPRAAPRAAPRWKPPRRPGSARPRRAAPGRGERASRSILLVAGSATRAAIHEATGTTPASWSRTSGASPGARGAARFSGRLAEIRVGVARARPAEARDLHERVRAARRRRCRVLRGGARTRARRPRRGRPRSRPPAGAVGRRVAGHNGLRWIEQH